MNVNSVYYADPVAFLGVTKRRLNLLEVSSSGRKKAAGSDKESRWDLIDRFLIVVCCVSISNVLISKSVLVQEQIDSVYIGASWLVLIIKLFHICLTELCGTILISTAETIHCNYLIIIVMENIHFYRKKYYRKYYF